MASYITILAKVEEVNDAGYTNQTTGEVVERVSFTLVVPSMKDRVQVEMPRAAAPTQDTLDTWELEEQWISVGCDGLRAIGFQRANPRPGEKAVGTMVIFSGVEAREATAQERAALQQARKEVKSKAKARRAERAAARAAAKSSASPAA